MPLHRSAKSSPLIVGVWTSQFRIKSSGRFARCGPTCSSTPQPIPRSTGRRPNRTPPTLSTPLRSPSWPKRRSVSMRCSSISRLTMFSTESRSLLMLKRIVPILLTSTAAANARGRNFFLTIRRLLRENEEVRVVSDQMGAPTSAHALADVTAELLGRHSAAGLGDAGGVYHVTARGYTSWHGFATEIARLELPDLPNPPRILAIASDQYPSPARRPGNSCLSNEKLLRCFGIELPRWEACLEALHKRLRQSARLDGGTPYRR